MMITDGFKFATPDAAVVASGALNANVAIPVSTNGAAVNDMIVIHIPYGVPSPSGTGWSSYEFPWFADPGDPGTFLYTGKLWWKKLTTLDDITITTTYGHSYIVHRGANTLAVVVDTESASSSATSLNFTLPTLGTGAILHGLLTAQQGGPDPTAPATFIDRFGATTSSIFMQGGMTDATPVAGSVAITNIGTGSSSTPCHVLAIELRS